MASSSQADAEHVHGLHIFEYSTGEKELYDLKRDPYELDNIAGSAPAHQLDELHRRMAELETRRDEGCRTADSRQL